MPLEAAVLACSAKGGQIMGKPSKLSASVLLGRSAQRVRKAVLPLLLALALCWPAGSQLLSGDPCSPATYTVTTGLSSLTSALNSITSKCLSRPSSS